LPPPAVQSPTVVQRHLNLAATLTVHACRLPPLQPEVHKCYWALTKKTVKSSIEFTRSTLVQAKLGNQAEGEHVLNLLAEGAALLLDIKLALLFVSGSLASQQAMPSSCSAKCELGCEQMRRSTVCTPASTAHADRYLPAILLHRQRGTGHRANCGLEERGSKLGCAEAHTLVKGQRAVASQQAVCRWPDGGPVHPGRLVSAA
jgi:hypothetical protein